MKTCENCGCRVYSLGCVNCDEEAYIEEQKWRTNAEIQSTRHERIESPSPGRLDTPAARR